MNIKQVIIDQRKELEEIVKKRKVVEREGLKNFKEYAYSSLIKVITGIRRCGKSFLTYLLLRDKKFAYANFDEKILLKIEPRELLSIFHEIYGEVNAIFLDEVQNYENWELMANEFHRAGYNLFITGSNAKLLSRELATHLTGRHVDIELFPFSFREFLSAKEMKFESFLSSKEIGVIKNALMEHMSIGGFPEVVVNDENPKIYLKRLFNDIIEKDIVMRYKIKYVETFREIAISLLSNFSNYVSFNKLKRTFRVGSEHTVKNYLKYLEETYLFIFLKRFSFKPKEVEIAERKAYSIDTGMAINAGYVSSQNTGKLMENLVAVELFRRKSYFNNNWEIFYFKDYQQHEVDFLIKEGLKVKQLIQVTYANSFDEIEHREIRALLRAKEIFKEDNPELLIITWDYEDEKEVSWFGKTGKIKFVPLWKWLLKF